LILRKCDRVIVLSKFLKLYDREFMVGYKIMAEDIDLIGFYFVRAVIMKM
jgi:hypothetical protein